MSLVFSLRMFGNLLNKSPIDMMMLALTPKSIFDLSNENIKSICSEQIIDDTHINLHKANIADLSKRHIVGAKFSESGFEYFSLAVLEIVTIGTRNFPNKPF